MTTAWSESELDMINAARELQISTRRADGELRRWVPIWVVRVDDQIYVRTWHRRDTGWFGHAVRTGRARIRVPGLEIDVAVRDSGADPDDLQIKISRAYATKYGSRGDDTVSGMVTPAAEQTTLRLTGSSSS